MNSILIVLAHPDLIHSRVNRFLVERIQGIEGVTLNNLYDQYPDFYIPKEEEQQKLLSHKHIVFQHPFYWYSAPALLKQWLDDVLGQGFAFGEGGNQLKGKTFTQVISTGGNEAAYQSSGYNGFTVSEFLRPFEQTARLCQMEWQQPLLFQGTRKRREKELDAFAIQYQQKLEDLIRG